MSILFLNQTKKIYDMNLKASMLLGVRYEASELEILLAYKERYLEFLGNP